MKKWTQEELENQGYRIANCKIDFADLSMADHGCLDMSLGLSGQVDVVFGGYVLGKGYLNAKDDFFKGSAAGTEYIMRIMDVVGVERFRDLKGMNVRVAHKGLSSSVRIIGNIIDDKWFDTESFFEDKRKES